MFLSSSANSLLRARFLEVISSSHQTEGKFVKDVAKVCSDLHSGMPSVAVSSCGAGLFATFSVLECKRVLVQANTFYATAAMAKEAGCEVTLVDCNLDDYSMDLEDLKAKFSGHDAVVLTHIGGKLAKYYEEIAAFCNENEIYLIEDAAHALGSKYKKTIHAGSLGMVAVFSVYPTKAVPVGEGGLVVAHSRDLIDRIYRFCNYGKAVEDGVIKYERGFNLRMDEWTAAVTLTQLERMDAIMHNRRAMADRIRDVVPSIWDNVLDDHEPNWYKYITEDIKDLNPKYLTGMVYQSTDQMHTVFGDTGDFHNCDAIAEKHRCVALSEDMLGKRLPNYKLQEKGHGC